MMIIANYLFIGAVLMFLVDSMSHWMQKTKTNSNNDYAFTNTERIIVIAFWPIVILFAVMNIIFNRTNQN